MQGYHTRLDRPIACFLPWFDPPHCDLKKKRPEKLLPGRAAGFEVLELVAQRKLHDPGFR
jgi:hypothetical protein